MLKLHSDNILATQFRVVTEQVRPVNCARPFLVWALILQVITPSAKKWSGYARLMAVVNICITQCLKHNVTEIRQKSFAVAK